MRTMILCCLLVTGSLVPVQAAVIAVFDNSAYVDTSGGPPAPGSDAVQALLDSLGHTVQPFTGITAADFTAATGAADLILFPHLLSFGALLTDDLTSSAKTALADYVEAGGGLITIGDGASRLLNVVFYPPGCCFASTGGAGPSFLDSAVAAGTPFATAPGELTSPPEAGNGFNPFAFTPPGGANLYEDQFGGITVLTAPFVTGHFGYLAWNYVGAVPGTSNGGWSEVLDIMVDAVRPPSRCLNRAPCPCGVFGSSHWGAP